MVNDCDYLQVAIVKEPLTKLLVPSWAVVRGLRHHPFQDLFLLQSQSCSLAKHGERVTTIS